MRSSDQERRIYKSLCASYDSGYAIVKDEVADRRAMTIAASYLPIAQEGDRDPSHYVPEFSRRARGFATWAMLKHLGRSGISALIDRCCLAARMIAERISREPGIEVVNDVVLNQIVCRFGAELPLSDADDLTRRVINRLQRDGIIFVAGAKWRGREVLRISVCNYQIDAEEASLAAKSIITSCRSECLSPGPAGI